LRRTVARPESLGYLLLAGVTLWVAFGLGGHNGFKLFYLLFLPVVWAAARQGMAGAIVCAAFVQVGIIVAMRLLHYNAVSVAELQILAMAIAMVGFFVAAAVDEQRRTGQELRQSLRLAAAGEMAATLTHELHHPLTALSAYAGACEQLLERGEVGERLHSAIRCVVRESARTSEVVHRLQGFFRSGSPELESVSLGELVDSAAAPYRLRAERSGIRLRIATMPDLTLRVDRLQVEVVLRSLLGFAFDAVSDSPRQPRRIWVAAWKDGHDRVCLRIEDSGSGLTPDQVLHLFEPIAPSGSGKRQSGLAISRAIVHSHGGRLWAETSNHGVLKCELPIERHAVAPAPVTPNEAAPAVS
jgi:C4-dicarboxylate-specific signal transduction histidine kinase